MGLPWFRMESNWASHDKILALLSDPSPKRWQAVTSWVAAMGWSQSHGTDGRIPTAALPWVHGTQATAQLLVKYGLWETRTAAYQIRNFGDRQPLNEVRDAVLKAKSDGGTRGNHVRWHVNKGVTDPDCPFCNGSEK